VYRVRFSGSGVVDGDGVWLGVELLDGVTLDVGVNEAVGDGVAAFDAVPLAVADCDGVADGDGSARYGTTTALLLARPSTSLLTPTRASAKQPAETRADTTQTVDDML
jgi:dynactin complex subunit